MEFKYDLEKTKETLNGKSELTVLGIDQGYANLGYAVITFNLDVNKVTLKKSGTITTPSSLEMNKRLVLIYNFIKSIICDYPEISIAGCEKLFHNKPMNEDNGKKNFFKQRNKSASIMKTNMASGVIYLLCGEYDIDIFDYAPTTVKKCLTGSGKANKEMIEEILEDFTASQGIELETNHQSDAIAIALTIIKDFLSKANSGKNDFIAQNIQLYKLKDNSHKRQVKKILAEKIEIDNYIKQNIKLNVIKRINKRYRRQYE